MHYDQSWMGYGWIGGLQAGTISAIAGVLLYALLRWRLRARTEHASALAWAFLLALLLTASGDLWDLFYFNYAQLQSLQLLKAKLAQVHDPDGIGTRVLCEFIGATIGVFAAWLVGLRRKSR